MNNFRSFFILTIFLNLTLIINSSNQNNKLDEIERRIGASGSLLQDFIAFFDKRITWLEENMQGIVANYTSCCSHLIHAEIDIAHLKAKVKSNHELVNQIKKITIDEL